MAEKEIGNATTATEKDVGNASTSTPPSNEEPLAVDLDWDATDDPENPRNWPLWNRILHSAIPALWSFGL